MLRLGYKASAEQFGPRKLLDFAVAAEENGFESVFVSDHFQPWRHSDGHSPFALAWLAATGERTKRVVLGTSVVTPTFRYHPAIVAQAFGTLGSLFPGRVILGVGTGEHLNEGALGIPWPENKERFARLREAIRLDRMIEVKVSYDTDRSRAMEDTKIWAALALPAEAKAGVDDPREMERLARGVEDVAHRRWLVSNDADEHIEQLKPYIELGFNHLVFHAPVDDQLRFLKLYGSQILPRLRKQWGG